MDTTARVALGKSSVRVTRIGLGTVPLGGLYTHIPAEEGHDIVRHAVGAGMRYLDTAPQYGSGLAERRLAKVLPEFPRDDLVVATKVGRLIRPTSLASTAGRVFRETIDNRDPQRFVQAATNVSRRVRSRLRGTDAKAASGPPSDASDPRLGSTYDFTYDGVMRSHEESLARLGLDRVDVLLLHDPDHYFRQAIDGGVRALAQLRADGTVGAIGVGMNQSAMLARFAEAAAFDCFLVAGRYTLLDQSALADLLPIVEGQGASVIVGGVYNSGILADPHPGAYFDYAPAPKAILDRVLRMQAVCQRYNVPLKAAALRFPLGHPSVATVLAGPASVAEVEDNARMMAIDIPDDLWAELRHEGLIEPHVRTPDQRTTKSTQPAGDPPALGEGLLPGLLGETSNTHALH